MRPSIPLGLAPKGQLAFVNGLACTTCTIEERDKKCAFFDQSLKIV